MNLSVERAHVVPRLGEPELPHRQKEQRVERETRGRAAGTAPKTSEAPPKASAVAAPTSNESRPSPITVNQSILGASEAISPSTTSSVEILSATVTPVRPQSERPTIEIGTSIHDTCQSQRDEQPGPVHDEEKRIRDQERRIPDHPRREENHEPAELVSTFPAKAGPSTAVTTRPPSSATRPAAAPTKASETHAECTTWSAALSASTPRRVNGAAEIRRARRPSC